MYVIVLSTYDIWLEKACNQKPHLEQKCIYCNLTSKTLFVVSLFRNSVVSPFLHFDVSTICCFVLSLFRWFIFSLPLNGSTRKGEMKVNIMAAYKKRQLIFFSKMFHEPILHAPPHWCGRVMVVWKLRRRRRWNVHHKLHSNVTDYSPFVEHK